MTTSESQASSNTAARLFWLFLSIFSSAPIAVVYGLIMRFAFSGIPGMAQPPEWVGSVLGSLSVAFLFLVPLSIGVLTVAFAPSEWRTSIWYALAMPALNCLLWSIVVAALLWEAAVCVVMALPIVLPLAVIGGMIMWVIFKVWRNLRQPAYAVAVFVVLPYVAAAIESRLPVYDSFHTVETTVIVHADPAAVWRNVVRVPEIQPDERDFRIFYVLGVPWPMEATLAYDGLGGLRAARYENGLRWAGPVTLWEPNQVVSFDIRILNPDRLPPPYNGLTRALDFNKATFVIEPLADGAVRLHLISEHRLTTRFNGYGALWTNFFVNDIQDHILHVVKQRAEAGN